MSSVVKTQKDLLEVFHDVFHSLQLSTDIVHGRHIEFRFKITAHPGQKERERIRNSLATSLSKAPAWVSMSVHAVAMSSSHSVVSAEVDHPGATCLRAFLSSGSFWLGFVPWSSVFYILSNHIFELLSFLKKKDRVESSSLCLVAKLGRARLLLFHLYWDDLLIVGLLMAYFDVRMARRKRLASLAATKKATPSRAPRT